MVTEAKLLQLIRKAKETGIDDDPTLSKFLAEHLNPDTTIKDEREGIEKLITVSETKLTCAKDNLKDLQDRCPHTDTELIYSYDGMALSKCNVCHKSLTSQGK